MISITPKTLSNEFPFEVFSEEIQQTFKDVAKEYSLPLNYIGASAVAIIGGLAGNVYTTPVNGDIKNIIFLMLVGPPSVGKSVVFKKLYSDITAELDKELITDYEHRLLEWKRKTAEAKKNGETFNDKHPTLRIRDATGATIEALEMYAEVNPAGFITYFDEAKDMFKSYSKDNNTTEFWNTSWNGGRLKTLRVKSENTRYIENMAISSISGIQQKKINSIFTESITGTGLVNRFLFCSSDYIKLNEDFSFFNEKRIIDGEWRHKVLKMFMLGVEYIEGQKKNISITQEAKIMFDRIGKNLICESNTNIEGILNGSFNEELHGYSGKIFAYLGRFMVICAIIKDHNEPVIDAECVINAEKLVTFFKYEAMKVLKGIINENETGLTQNEANLLNLLPDKFTKGDADILCKTLKLSSEFFKKSFLRKYNNKYVKRIGQGIYEKL